MEYYLYNQKLLYGELSLNEFMGNAKFKYNFENLSVVEANCKKSVLKEGL